MFRSLLFRIWFLLLPASLFSQVSLTVDSNATLLAQKLVGSGVAVSNATLLCNGKAVSKFSYAGTNFDLPHGILLTTGYAADAVYSPAVGVAIVSESTGLTYTDSNLVVISSGAINDVCLLAFDFMAPSNKINAGFVFGSSEYNGYQCSGYNDAFGIFLSGYDPSGTYYKYQNMGVLSAGTPVTINTVNNGGGSCTSASNPSFFIDNNASPTGVLTYWGYTRAIRSFLPVAKDSAYHLEIVIADAGDEVYDSGVFIEDSMFNCQSLPNVRLDSLGFSDTLCMGATTYTLTGGSPAGGTYFGPGVTGNILNTNGMATGDYVINYSYTDTAGCGGLASHTLTIQGCATGVNPGENNGGFLAYPNPAGNSLTVTSSADLGLLCIFNSLGENVMQLKNKSKQEQINISKLSPGIYILQTQSGRVKFVKE